MKKLLSKYKRVILYTLLLLFICTADFVYAKTTGEIKFCDYGSVQRTLKIIGILILIMKIVAPLIIIATAFFAFFKPVISGTVDDFKGSFKTLMMKIIAGLIIFVIPSMLDYTFDNLLGAEDSSFNKCSNCLLDVDSCNPTDEVPEYYTDDSK